MISSEGLSLWWTASAAAVAKFIFPMRQSEKRRRLRALRVPERPRTHNVTLSVIAMCIGNPDCSPIGINR
jgi:hypothetical protein